MHSSLFFKLTHVDTMAHCRLANLQPLQPCLAMSGHVQPLSLCFLFVGIRHTDRSVAQELPQRHDQTRVARVYICVHDSRGDKDATGTYNILQLKRIAMPETCGSLVIGIQSKQEAMDASNDFTEARHPTHHRPPQAVMEPATQQYEQFHTFPKPLSLPLAQHLCFQSGGQSATSKLSFLFLPFPSDPFPFLGLAPIHPGQCCI